MKKILIVKIAAFTLLLTGCGDVIESSEMAPVEEVGIVTTAAAGVEDSFEEITSIATNNTKISTTKATSKKATKATTKVITSKVITSKVTTSKVTTTKATKTTTKLTSKTSAAAIANKTTIKYYVRKSWDDFNSQIGAYVRLDNAKAAAQNGYKVFDGNGKVVWEGVTNMTTTTAQNTPAFTIDAYSRQLLSEICWHEAGSNWISLYDKAHIVAATMNRVYDSRFPNTVYAVLTQPGQFTGYWPGCCTPTQACYDAVDYYFAHQGEFDACNSWSGNGYANVFYRQ